MTIATTLDEKPEVTTHVLSAVGSLDERRAEIARLTGLDAARIDTKRLDIQTMRELGLLVNISVHGLSILMSAVTWADLGIGDGDERRKRLKPGRKALIPSVIVKRLKTLEARLRQSLDKRSFSLAGLRPYRWVPFTAYADWQAEWEKLQTQWQTVVQEILDDHAKYKKNLKADFTTIAQEAWAAATSRSKAGKKSVTINGKTFKTRKAYVDHVVSAVLVKYPSQERLQSLHVTYNTALVLSPADAASEDALLAAIRDTQALEHAKHVATVAQVDAKTATARSEVTLAELVVVEEAKAQDIRLTAMHDAEMARANEQLSEIISPFEEVFDLLRSRIHQDVAEITASISSNGHVRGRVAGRARKLIDTFRLLNAHEDETLEQALQELQDKLSTERVDRSQSRYDTAAVLSDLEKITNMTAKEAKAVVDRMSEGPTRAVAMEF